MSNYNKTEVEYPSRTVAIEGVNTKQFKCGAMRDVLQTPVQMMKEGEKEKS